MIVFGLGCLVDCEFDIHNKKREEAHTLP